MNTMFSKEKRQVGKVRTGGPRRARGCSLGVSHARVSETRTGVPPGADMEARE
jgi:hypothetical protein